MDYAKTLKELSQLHAPTGEEDEVADYLEKHFKACGFKVERDVLGNVIARKGEGKKVMLAGHMDEISMVVKSITEKGFLKFAKVGGIYDAQLVATRVLIHTNPRRIGVIASKPPHLMKDEEMKKVQEASELCVDGGFADRKDAEKAGIRPGTHITFLGQFSEVSKNLVVGKTFDNRVGCTILCALAETYAKKMPPCELMLVGTVREESGLFGAGAAAFALDPDFAVAVDVTNCIAPGITEEELPVIMGQGPSLGVIEGGGYGLITSRKLVDWMDSVAKKHKLKLQFDVHERGATDASRMQYVRKGILAASLGVPLRYMHSQSEMLDLDDLKSAISFVEKVIEEFPTYK